jgi:hypothetical protein
MGPLGGRLQPAASARTTRAEVEGSPPDGVDHLEDNRGFAVLLEIIRIKGALQRAEELSDDVAAAIEGVL